MYEVGVFEVESLGFQASKQCFDSPSPFVGKQRTHILRDPMKDDQQHFIGG